MYGITLKHAPSEACPRCKRPYSEDRPKTFFAFIDPIFISGPVTLYGAECCTECEDGMQRWGTARRLEIVTVAGLSFLGLEPVHICLASWSSWCPRSYERYGLLRRASLNQILSSKGVHHAG